VARELGAQRLRQQPALRRGNAASRHRPHSRRYDEDHEQQRCDYDQAFEHTTIR
jgi:hypothetical protein